MEEKSASPCLPSFDDNFEWLILPFHRAANWKVQIPLVSFLATLPKMFKFIKQGHNKH